MKSDFYKNVVVSCIQKLNLHDISSALLYYDDALKLKVFKPIKYNYTENNILDKIYFTDDGIKINDHDKHNTIYKIFYNYELEELVNNILNKFKFATKKIIIKLLYLPFNDRLLILIDDIKNTFYYDIEKSKLYKVLQYSDYGFLYEKALNKKYFIYFYDNEEKEFASNNIFYFKSNKFEICNDLLQRTFLLTTWNKYVEEKIIYYINGLFLTLTKNNLANWYLINLEKYEYQAFII